MNNNRKVLFVIIIVALCTCLVYSNEADTPTEQDKQYLTRKITMDVKQEFDVLYPLNVNRFTFIQGEKKLSFEEFLALTKDPLLLQNQKKIKKVKNTGFSVAAVSGVCAGIFIIPAVVFTALQTNHNQVDPAFIFSGVGTYMMSGLSLVVLFVDLIITFSFLHKYRFNEFAVRQAVERYNKKVRDELGIVPEFSFRSDALNFGLRIVL